MSFYQRKTLVPLADVGVPGPLPDDLFGLEDVSLADVELAVGTPAATQLGYLNTGFFPVLPPVTLPAVSNGAFRVALRRAGQQANFQGGVNSLGNEFKDWYDHQPYFTPGDGFLTAAVAAAGGTLPAQIAAIILVAQGLTQPS